MQITLTSEQEMQLSHLAMQEGKDADELAHDLFSRGLAAEAHFLAAVRLGQDAADLGKFLEASEVWAGIESALKI